VINYNGIDLDYYDSSLKGLVVKGGLTKIDSLGDRTTISSTEFELPRTANNELAFGNITTEGAQGSAFGSAYIKLDGNVFATGTLYIKGYNDNNFQCIFFGADGDLIKVLKDKPLWAVFPKDQHFTFTDANIKAALQSETVKVLGEDITYHFGNPFLQQIYLSAETAAPFFNVKSLVYKILSDEGFTLVSNFLDSDFGLSLDYSDFSGTSLETSLCSNGFNDSGEQIPTSAPTLINTPYPDMPNVQLLDLGTALAGNTSITEGTFKNGKKYILSRDIEKLKIIGKINFTKGDLDDAQFFIDVWNSFGVNNRYTTSQLTGFGNSLQEGVNNFSLDLDWHFDAGEIITFGVHLKTDKPYPLNNSSIVIESCTISHDDLQQGDSVSFKDYISNMTQLDFLKGVLNQFNLVFDIEGESAFIELQDEGIEPLGSTPSILPSIATEHYDLSNIIRADSITGIEYLQSDTIYLKQKISNNSYTETTELMPYQSYGSYLFKLNTFNNTTVDTIESFFNGLYDSDSRYLRGFGWAKSFSQGAPPTSWEKVLSCRYSYQFSGYNGTINVGYTNEDTTVTNVDVLVNWSEPAMIGKVYEGLFKNTLEQKKNNKIIAVIFKDELGTIISNRRTYIIDNQKYKLIDWDFDLQTKLVKANLIMK